MEQQWEDMGGYYGRHTAQYPQYPLAGVYELSAGERAQYDLVDVSDDWTNCERQYVDAFDLDAERECVLVRWCDYHDPSCGEVGYAYALPVAGPVQQVGWDLSGNGSGSDDW